MSQSGLFTDKWDGEVDFSRFCTNVFYGRPLTIFYPILITDSSCCDYNFNAALCVKKLHCSVLIEQFLEAIILWTFRVRFLGNLIIIFLLSGPPQKCYFQQHLRYSFRKKI